MVSTTHDPKGIGASLLQGCEKYNNTEDLMLHTLLKSEKPKLLILAEQELSNGKC